MPEPVSTPTSSSSAVELVKKVIMKIIEIRDEIIEETVLHYAPEFLPQTGAGE